MKCWLARRYRNGPNRQEDRFDVSGSLLSSGPWAARYLGRVAASDEQIREQRAATRCAACSSPVPGSAPYRAVPEAPLRRDTRTDAPPSPAPMPCASRPPPRRRPDRGRRRLPGFIATCQATSQQAVHPGACPHPGSPRRPMPERLVTMQQHARLRHVRRVGGRRRQADPIRRRAPRPDHWFRPSSSGASPGVDEYEESLKALDLLEQPHPQALRLGEPLCPAKNRYREEPAEQLKQLLHLYVPAASPRDHFVDVVAEVETGGASRAKVDEAKDTLLEKSRAYNASGPGYVKDFELIQESLKRLAMPSSFDSEEPSRQESEEEDPGK